MNLGASEQVLVAAMALAQRAGREAEAPQPFDEIWSMGDFYFGMYRLDWSFAAADLQARGLAEVNGGSLALTTQGAALAGLLSPAHPRSLYAYNEFFYRARRSAAHARFCERVYGRDLCQHGMLDMEQLDALADLLRRAGARDVLELGCGNGAAAETLARATGARVTGIDQAAEGIAWAQEYARKLPGRLEFAAGDMQRVDFAPASFDALLLIDSLYFVKDLPAFLRRVLPFLRPGGYAYIHISLWGGDPSSQAALAPDAAPLALALRSLGASYAVSDYSDREAAHWRRKLAVLEEMRAAFEAEGSGWLWLRRWSEADSHQPYVACGGVRRYLYTVGPAEHRETAV